MNVCLVCYPTAGGSGVIATELALSLVERGHTVHIVANDRPIRMGEQKDGLVFHEINVPSYDLFPDASYGMSGACALMDLLQQEDIDLIHAHYAFPHALSAYLALDMLDHPDIPIITTLHGSDIYLAEDHPCHFNIVQSSLKRSTRVTAVSNYLKDETHRIFGDELEIDVISNFVDTETFQPRSLPERRAEICSPDDCLLVHVSNYRPIKRSGDMAHLLREMLEHGVRTHLLMIGDGPERERVEATIGEFHMREHVTWVDPVEQVNEWIALGDFLVVTSERESFSMAALEAMACGLPVLNTAEGGVRELVRDGTDGYHVEDRDLHELARRTADLLEDPDRLGQMRKAVRERVTESFSQEYIVDQYIDLYREAVEGETDPDSVSA